MSSDEEDSASSHWTERLFVDNAEVYLPFLEAAIPRAEVEVGLMVEQFDELGVPAGARVLDAGCGIGRHCIELASRGYEVVGMDISPLFLEEARLAAESAGVSVKLIRGDMREAGRLLEDEGPFHAVVNMFTSHGYSQKGADLQFFRALHRLCAPGAALVLETLNRDYVVRNFTPVGYEEAGNICKYDHRSFDLETSSVHSRWSFYEKSGDELMQLLSVDLELRAYSLHEMRELLARAGWEPVRSFTLEGEGGLTTAVGADSMRMWVVARRG